MKCRFNGHCSPFYSVAEHSVRVSWLLEQQGKRQALWGLMHDAGEAYLPDLGGPIKKHFHVHDGPNIESFDDAEDRLLATIAGRPSASIRSNTQPSAKPTLRCLSPKHATSLARHPNRGTCHKNLSNPASTPGPPPPLKRRSSNAGTNSPAEPTFPSDKSNYLSAPILLHQLLN